MLPIMMLTAVLSRYVWLANSLATNQPRGILENTVD